MSFLRNRADIDENLLESVYVPCSFAYIQNIVLVYIAFVMLTEVGSPRSGSVRTTLRENVYILTNARVASPSG